MTAILEELASGRIDAAEAARQIDALTVESLEETTSEPSTADLASAPDLGLGGDPSPGAQLGQDSDTADLYVSTDSWAAATDRPQRATVTTESFSAAEGSPTPEAAEEPAETKVEEPGETQAEELLRSKPVNTGGVDRISVRAVGRRVRIIGEASVATLSADGPHVLRRNGSVLEVSSDGEMGSSLDGFSILRAPRSLDDIRAIGLGKELLLKVNPRIVVDVEVTAGSLHTERVPHLGKVRVTAGGAKLLDVEEINDALVQAGQATIKGAIKNGRSRVRAESGSLVLHLADDSNVTIKSDAQLGKVSWSGSHSGNFDEVVMGNGSAKLDVEVVMGHAQVKVGSDAGKEKAGAA